MNGNDAAAANSGPRAATRPCKAIQRYREMLRWLGVQRCKPPQKEFKAGLDDEPAKS